MEQAALDLILKIVIGLFTIGGWFMYFRSLRYKERIPYKWRLRWHESGRVHISTHAATPSLRIIESIKYTEEEK